MKKPREMLTNSLSKTTTQDEEVINLWMFFWHILRWFLRVEMQSTFSLSTESLHLCDAFQHRPPTMSSLEIFNEMRRDCFAHGQKSLGQNEPKLPPLVTHATWVCIRFIFCSSVYNITTFFSTNVFLRFEISSEGIFVFNPSYVGAIAQSSSANLVSGNSSLGASKKDIWDSQWDAWNCPPHVTVQGWPWSPLITARSKSYPGDEKTLFTLHTASSIHLYYSWMNDTNHPSSQQEKKRTKDKQRLFCYRALQCKENILDH